MLGWRAGYIDYIGAHKEDSNTESRNLRFSKNSMDKFENILKELIPIFMPRSYLENYNSYAIADVNEIESINYPKVIFTSNSHYNDDAFKAYCMQAVNVGSRLVLGQHGGGALNRYEGAFDFELSIADRYITPGYENTNIDPKITAIGQLFNNPKNRKYNKKGGGLLVTVAMPRYSFCLFSAVISGQMLYYFEDQFKFYDNLTPSIRNQLKVRLYHHDYEWNQKQRWLDRYPSVQFDESRKMDKAIRQSRLMIGTYAATTYNETLANNIPTIIYWNPKYWELIHESDLYFEELKKVGIFHETPESAAKQVVKIWDDIDSWWYDPKLQKVREIYCRAFAYVPDHLGAKLKNLLVEEEEKYDAEQCSIDGV